MSDAIYRPRNLPDGPPDLLGVLGRIAATGRGRWQDRDGPFLQFAGARQGRFRWQTLTGGAQQLVLADAESGATLVALPLAAPCWLDPATGAFGPLDTEIDAAQWHLLLRAPQIPAEIAAEVAARLTGLGADHIPAPKAVGIEVRHGRAPVPVLRLFGMRGQVHPADSWRRTRTASVQPALRLAFDYGGQIAPARHAEPLRFREGETVVTLRRDAAAEAAALADLQDCGALPPEAALSHSFGQQAERHDRVFVDGEWDPEREVSSQATGPALRFLGERVPRLRAAGWRVEVDPTWPCPLAEDPVQMTAHVGDGEGGLFDFGLTLRAGDQAADLAPLVATLLAGLPADLTEDEIDGPGFTDLLAATPCYLPLPDGRHARVDPGPLADLLRVLLRNLGLMTRVHPAEAGQIVELAQALEGCGIPFQGSAALMELGRRLSALTSAEAVRPPAALRATLRPYQAAGYGWLCALSASGFFVYRLVAEGTVEEAILALQARKQALADALFEGGRMTGTVLDMDTITDLFRPLSQSLPGRWS